jgi:SAM-dependent methyltransferase
MGSDMRTFWDRRAAESPFFFVDSRVDYHRPDLERFWAEGERDLDRLLAALGVAVLPTDRVLEIGCGVGRLTRVLATRGASVCALDVSERMLAIARSLHPELENVEWILGDGSTLAGMGSDTVDVCVSHVTFQHIPDPAITLGYVREMGRVLRPGGWGAFQVSNHPVPHRRPSAVERMRQSALALAGRAPRGQHDPRWLGSMIELDALRSAAREGSMEIERVVGAGTQFCGVLTRRLTR